MNLLFLDQYSDLGGAQRCFLDAAPALLAHGVTLACGLPGEGPFAAALRAARATVYYVPCGPFSHGRKTAADMVRFLWQFPRATRRIRRLVDRHATGVLYVNGPRVLAQAARAVGKECRILFHCHHRLEHAPAEWLVRRVLRNGRITVVAPCRFAAEPWLDSIPEGRLHIVPNCSPERPYRDPRERAGAEWRVGIIGRVCPEKGQAEFLAAARLLSQSSLQYRFVVCGAALFQDRRASEYEARLAALARGLPVEFIGWRDDIDPVLRELDLLVVPSQAPEAQPRVILEAFAAGVPVVSVSSGGILELIGDGLNGFLAPAAEPTLLARRIAAAIAEGRDGLARVAEQARKRWERLHRPAAFQQRIIEVVESLER